MTASVQALDPVQYFPRRTAARLDDPMLLEHLEHPDVSEAPRAADAESHHDAVTRLRHDLHERTRTQPIPDAPSLFSFEESPGRRTTRQRVILYAPEA